MHRDCIWTEQFLRSIEWMVTPFQWILSMSTTITILAVVSRKCFVRKAFGIRQIILLFQLERQMSEKYQFSSIHWANFKGFYRSCSSHQWCIKIRRILKYSHYINNKELRVIQLTDKRIWWWWVQWLVLFVIINVHRSE